MLRPAFMEAFDRVSDDTAAGLTTGLHSLDNLIGGLKPGNLIAVGARPSVGK